MKFELEENYIRLSDEYLLEEIRRCAKVINRDTITIAEYEEVGKTHPSTIQRRFGSWSKALNLAGLKPSRSKIGVTDDELLKNIEQLWINLGRQPRYNEVKIPASQYSAGTYENRFGSWSNALKVFVEWVNAEKQEIIEVNESQAFDKNHNVVTPQNKRRTNREISERQRFRILVRDGFRCLSCGASPLITPGVELHVDHIIPWSKGGETVDENLQTKCKQCNLGKGNAFDV